LGSGSARKLAWTSASVIGMEGEWPVRYGVPKSNEKARRSVLIVRSHC